MHKTAYDMRISGWGSDVCSSGLDLVARGHQEFAGFTRRDQLVDEAAIVVEIGVRLRDGVLLLFHRREVDDVGRHLISDERRAGNECVRTCSFRWSREQ